MTQDCRTIFRFFFKQSLLRKFGLKGLIVLQESVLVEFFEESLCPYVSPRLLYSLHRIAPQLCDKIIGK